MSDKKEVVWFYDNHKNQEVYNDGKYQATVSIDEGAEWYDPRTEQDNIGKICIRKHRDYRFPNELDFDFDAYDEDEIKTPENYYIFRLDCYEHGQIVFSFTGEGMQCRRDTTNHCGFIAVPIEGRTRDEAREIAEQELKEFNQYNNGEIYGYTVYRKVLWTSELGEVRYDYDVLDSVGGYFDIDSCKEEAISVINAYKKEEVEG